MSKGNPAERLEDDFHRAKARGRWLSDDEQAELDREADAVAVAPLPGQHCAVPAVRGPARRPGVAAARGRGARRPRGVPGRRAGD